MLFNLSFLFSLSHSLLHVLSGFDENIESQGELILQESFQVWDPKTLIRKGRERHLFLFEMSLIFSKDVKDSNGRGKYLYKSKLMVWVLLVYLFKLIIGSWMAILYNRLNYFMFDLCFFTLPRPHN